MANTTQDLREPAPPKIQIVRILHAEDNPIIAGILQDLAEHQGWDLDHCVEGEAALKQLASVVHYDLLLVDYELLGMNGLELVKRARNMVHRRFLPIVMMSGTLDEREARHAGADAFLRKPQDIKLLGETITRLLGEDEQDT